MNSKAKGFLIVVYTYLYKQILYDFLMVELSKIKKEYSVLEKKYDLPSFEELNQNFEIEKIEHESDCLIRVFRKMAID
jgi:hypothetical protein